MRPYGSLLWRHFRIYQVFGANTNVGKTIVSTILLRHLGRKKNAWYLKPVSTGALNDADVGHLNRHAPGATTQNFLQFDSPVSPHLAAAQKASSDDTSDGSILEKTFLQIQTNERSGPGFMLVETAGGPNSPAPSGTLQAELYRPLRLPTIFVADWQLGGISTSISAFESLRMRGYDVEGVAVLKDSYYKNFEYFRHYFGEHDIPVLAVPQPPPVAPENDISAMAEYYGLVENDANSSVAVFSDELDFRHEARVSRLHGTAKESFEKIWWPFTQHKTLRAESLTTIDSAYGDYFQTLLPNSSRDIALAKEQGSEPSLLQPTVDGSASWWTQGLGHANHELTMAAAHAAGRYGHVMFAEAINEPALSLATNLLRTVDNSKLKRVFYSDNGSTGMEVGVKMALTATCARYEWDIAQKNIEVIGLQGSYHGDTIGSMDMSEPSVFNDRIHWYRGRGHWFEAPSVTMRKGKWVIQKPKALQGEHEQAAQFTSLSEVFDPNRDLGDDAAAYEKHIRSTLDRLTMEEMRHFGAVVMEPVVLGAGGMILVDPLFQRTLVNVVRSSTHLFTSDKHQTTADLVSGDWSGLPILADEVFTGLYRLGHASSSTLLHIEPDIAAYAKLLTGGLVPLSCTLASEKIFEAFLADSKADSLLHGHSYTAHPIGCAVANTSLKLLNKIEAQGAWDAFKSDWSVGAPVADSATSMPQVWSVWSQGFVSALSHHTERVDSVWALGSVLSISLRDDSGGGYASNAAKSLQQQLLAGSGEGWNIHSRVLGNVLYLMTSQTSEIAHVRAWERQVKAALGI